MEVKREEGRETGGGRKKVEKVEKVGLVSTQLIFIVLCMFSIEKEN